MNEQNAAQQIPTTDQPVVEQPPIASEDIEFVKAKAPIVKRFFRVILALVGITIFGFVAGYIFQERLVGTPGDFLNAIRFVFRFAWPVYLGYLILVTFLMSLPFILLSSARPNKAIAFTGLLAYLLGESIKALDFTKFFAGNIPAPYDADGNTPAPSIVAAAFSYMLAFMILLAVEHIVDQDNTNKKVIHGLALTPLVAAPIVAAVLAGTPLFSQQQRDRHTQHFARSETITSGKDAVYYKATQNLNGLGQVKDELRLEKLFNPYALDAQSNCGTDAFSPSSLPSAQKAAYSYAFTEKGHEYGTVSFTGFSSSNKTKSNEYTEHRYCFVAGFYKYTLIRSPLFYGATYQEEYPVQSVIDAIHDGDKAVITCDNTNQPEYCREEDSNKLIEIIVNANNYYTAPRNDGNYISQQYSNPSAYQTEQTLTISEWGVQLSVPKDLGELSYKPATGDATGTMSLTSSLFTKPECNVGLFATSTGSRQRTNGIATVRRTNAAEAKARYEQSRAESNGQSFSSVSGMELADGYIYSITTNSYLRDCLAAENITRERSVEIEDMLNWMETQFKVTS